MQTITDLQTQIAALRTAAPQPFKQRIPMSGLTNRLTGQDMFLEEHEYPSYMELAAQYIAELRPVGVRETQLAQKIIDLNWRLNTISAVENNLFHSSRLNAIAPNDPNNDKIVGMTSKAAVWRQDCESANAFEKLGRHETRIQRSLFRMTAELERFQAIRLKSPANDTFVREDSKAWIWYDHMLALHTQLIAARRAEAEAATEAANHTATQTATQTESTPSDPELLCKKANAATFSAAAGSLVEYAFAHGLLTPEQRARLERRTPE